MERDLRNIRKKRAERDRARDRANGIPSPGALAREAEELAQQANASAFEDTAQGQVPGDGEETLMDENGDLIAKIDEDKVIGTGQGMPQDSSNSAGLAITLPSDPSSKDLDQPQNSDQQPVDDLNAPDMMDTSDPVNVEFFESMFNDDMASADDTLNFGDFAFSMDTSNDTNQALNNNDNTLQNSSLPDVDLTSTSNEDINSLLPGLENYVTGSDFANINIPASTSTNQPDTNNQGTTAPTTTTTNLANTAPAAAADATTTADTSTLDSFFDFNFDMNNNGGDEMMGDGTLDDFDTFDWN